MTTGIRNVPLRDGPSDGFSQARATVAYRQQRWAELHRSTAPGRVRMKTVRFAEMARSTPAER